MEQVTHKLRWAILASFIVALPCQIQGVLNIPGFGNEEVVTRLLANRFVDLETAKQVWEQRAGQQVVNGSRRESKVLFVAADRSKTAPESLCTPIPSLYKDWKNKTLGQGATDEKIREYINKNRKRIIKDKLRDRDPFTPIANNKAERKRRGERVLWEDNRVFVLVDKFHDRGSSTPKPLVIPKEKMNFPIDASPELLRHLATVAATTSDALMWAAGKECNSSSFSRIYINPPTVIGVAQLHVHVKPLVSAPELKNTKEFYDRVSQYLVNRLGQGEGAEVTIEGLLGEGLPS